MVHEWIASSADRYFKLKFTLFAICDIELCSSHETRAACAVKESETDFNIEKQIWYFFAEIRLNRMDSLRKLKVLKWSFFGHFWTNVGHLYQIPVIQF